MNTLKNHTHTTKKKDSHQSSMMTRLGGMNLLERANSKRRSMFKSKSVSSSDTNSLTPSITNKSTSSKEGVLYSRLLMFMSSSTVAAPIMTENQNIALHAIKRGKTEPISLSAHSGIPRKPVGGQTPSLARPRQDSGGSVRTESSSWSTNSESSEQLQREEISTYKIACIPEERVIPNPCWDLGAEARPGWENY
jgi:hypothetical protein